MRTSSIYEIPNGDFYFQLLLKGDERGLSYIVNHIRHDIYKGAYYYIRNDFQAKTITQEAFLGAWNKRSEILNCRHFVNYVRKIVDRRCFDYFSSSDFKFSKRVTSFPISDSCHLVGYDPCSEEKERLQSAINEQSLQLIKQAVPYLRGDKKIITQLQLRGVTDKEIARLLEVSPQWLTGKKKQALKELKLFSKRIKKDAQEYKREPIRISDFGIYLTPAEKEVLEYYNKEYRFSEISLNLNMSIFKVNALYFSAINKINKKSYGNKKRWQ